MVKLHNSLSATSFFCQLCLFTPKLTTAQQITLTKIRLLLAHNDILYGMLYFHFSCVGRQCLKREAIDLRLSLHLC